MKIAMNTGMGNIAIAPINGENCKTCCKYKTSIYTSGNQDAAIMKTEIFPIAKLGVLNILSGNSGSFSWTVPKEK